MSVMYNPVIRQRATTTNLLEFANQNRDQGFFSDVTIVAGTETVPANRLVLSCYSTYFDKYFKFLERNSKYESAIEIENVDGNALKNLIDYIYNGYIVITEKNVVKLMLGADYLQMQEVKQFCFEFIVKSNASIVVHASLAEDLKKEIQQYRYRNNFDEFVQTDDFKAFSNEELTACILSLDRCQDKESSIFEGIVAWTNHNVEARKIVFLELFKMVDLQKVPTDYLEEVILEETLVKTTVECHELALNIYRDLVKKNKVDPKASKLLRLGGKEISAEVKVVYDLSPGSSADYPDLPEKHILGHCSLTLSNHIYCIGGNLSNTSNLIGIDSVWRLNTKKLTSGWEQVASMNAKRCTMGAAVYGDVIVVAGGSDENSYVIASTEVYQTSFNKWRTISPLKQQRHAHALVSCDGCLYAIGGRNGNCLASVERLDDLKGEWINIEPMQTPRNRVAAVNCDGVVYAIGGRSGGDSSTTLKTVEKYDSSANKWKYVSDMNFKRRCHAACVLRNKIYVVGGLDVDSKVVTQAECYDPRCDTWNIVSYATEVLYHHTLVAV